MKKGYLAGALFKDGERLNRMREQSLLKENLPEVEFYNPMENTSINDKTKPVTAEQIFWGDTNRVLEADVFIGEIDDHNVGTACELGQAWTINHIHDLVEQGKSLEEILEKYPRKKIYGHNSDIRLLNTNYQGFRVPFGINQFVMGCVLVGGKMLSHIEGIIEDLKK